MPSDLDDVQTWELLEIVEYRRLQERDEKGKEAEGKEVAARAAVEQAAREYQEHEAKLASGPPVIGKKPPQV
ncbi:MAG: hypothetical protein ABI440_15225 [Casimicrobiaceae bacterium]